MAFDEKLGERMGKALQKHGVEEKRMFGGLCFMLGGHMCCGIIKDELLVRVDPDRFDALLSRPHARIMDFTGRPMKGFIMVEAKGYRTEAALGSWLEEGVKFARSLPPKKASGKKTSLVKKAAGKIPARRRAGE